jgi:hypothetical protein
MKGLILLTSAVVLALVGTSVYLSIQLSVEREQRRGADSRAAALESRLEKLAHQQAVSAVARLPAPAKPARAQSGSVAPPTASAAQEENALSPRGERLQRKLFDNASGQALLKANLLADLKARNPELARRLNLTDAEHQKLLDLLAEQQLAQRSAFMGGTGPGPLDFEEARARERRAVAALIGEERARKYEEYKKGAPDRQQVRWLRSRLGEVDSLTDEQATTLASALQEERELFSSELKDQFGGHAGFTMSTMYGGVFMSPGGTVDEDGQERQLVDQMQSYNRRMKDRASRVLTTGQLKVFAEMQETQLAQQRVSLRTMRETAPSK